MAAWYSGESKDPSRSWVSIAVRVASRDHIQFGSIRADGSQRTPETSEQIEARPDGVVTDEEFRVFLDEEVTPRFPDGLTLLKGDGQFRLEDGEIIKEDSFLLILLYPLEGFRESSGRIDARRLYRTQFQQESVLRVDDPIAVRVSF